MNKICTSLEQSKKLIELGIDVNTADMCYSSIPVREWKDKNDTAQGIHLVFKEKVFVIENTNDEIGEEDTPAWSLTALLELIPPGNILLRDALSEKYKCINTVDSNLYDNPVDAAFEMVCWLIENKKL